MPGGPGWSCTRRPWVVCFTNTNGTLGEAAPRNSGESSGGRRLPGVASRRNDDVLRALRSRGRRASFSRVEICFSSLKREFRLGETLATMLTGLVARINAKIVAYTYSFLI